MARLVAACSLLLLATTGLAIAQAPVEGLHASAGPGAGLTSPVSATGSYATAVPLDLPSPRGPVPVPVSIVHTGSPRAGVAGVGWDVPLSYVRRSTSAWQRKPRMGGGDEAVERIFLTLDGSTSVMVPIGDHYVPFVSGAYQELRRQGDSWSLTTIDNVEYTFSPATTIAAASGGPGIDDPDLWLLTEIRERSGRDRIKLRYETPQLGLGPNQCAPELLLTSVAYTFDTTGQRPLYEVVLEHAPWWRPAGWRAQGGGRIVTCGLASGDNAMFAFEHVQDEQMGFDRVHTLSAVKVLARDNLAPDAAPRQIRSYQLAYTPDSATDQPRLTSVTTRGEEGHPLGTSTQVVSTYGYGATIDQSVPPAQSGDSAGAVRFGERTEIARLPLVGTLYTAGLTTTTTSTEPVHAQTLVDNMYEVGVRSRTLLHHVLRDFTGDGLPDILYKLGNTWYLQANRLGPDGPDLSMVTDSWTGDGGPAELQHSTTLRLTTFLDQAVQPLVDHQRDAMVITETWSQFTDWNGDGRLDVLDADGGTDADHWKVWLNKPNGPWGISWQPIQVDIANVRAWLVQQGHVLTNDMRLGIGEQGEWSINVPLARTRAWPHHYGAVAQGQVTDITYSQQSLTEWQLADRNGDGFPDFVAATVPVRRCKVEGQLEQGNWTEELPRSTTSCSDLAEDSRAAYLLHRNGPFTNIWYPPFWGDAIVTDERTPYGVEGWVSGAGEVRPWQHGLVPEGMRGPDRPGFTWQSATIEDQRMTGTAKAERAWHYEERRWGPTFQSDFDQRCPEPVAARDYLALQVAGTADLNGDGRGDLIYAPTSWSPFPGFRRPDTWKVRFATGRGYGPERRLVAPSDHAFALSETLAACPWLAATRPDVHTIAGLTDMDGDGWPELLRVSDDGRLFMARLETYKGRVDAGGGRLATVDNGHGATTSISYANRKTEGGGIPAPEIVVSQVDTRVADGSAPDSAPTFYAYGGPTVGYDPLGGRWTFLGYRRQVTVAGTASPLHPSLLEAMGTVVDRGPPAEPGTDFSGLVTANQVVRSAELELPAFAPTQIANLLYQEWGLRAAATPGYGVAVLQDSVPTYGAAQYECGDFDPATGDVGGTAACGAAGLLYTRTTQSWTGDVAPPLTGNVQSGASVEAIDGFGRPTRVHDAGDLRRTDDDVCTTTVWASTPDGRPFPSVPARVTLDDCAIGRTGGGAQEPVVLASTGYRYDHLAEGAHTGLVTSRLVDRYGPSGYLDTIVADEVEYGPFAQPVVNRSQRVLGGAASRETTITLDAFGLTTSSATVTATDALPQTTTSAVSSWPSRPATITDPTGVQEISHRDSFGRTVLSQVADSAGTVTSLRRVTYRDAGTRSVEVDAYPAGAVPGTETTASDRQHAVTTLDALGRPRFTEHALGADYGNARLITDFVQFDALGREVFSAQPFSVTGDFDPGTVAQTRYGTTTLYDRRGRVTRTVSALGRDEQSWTSDPLARRYVTTWAYAFSSGQAWTQMMGPDGNDPASPNASTLSVQVTTAAGRAIESATMDGTGAILDRVATVTDRLGRVTETRRYGAAGTTPVLWRATYDSLGRRLTLEEPGASPQTTTYDEDGNPLENWWQDGSVRRLVRMRYDGLGRLVRRSLVDAPAGAPEVESGVDQYLYDQPAGPPPSAPAVPAAYLGRLAAVTTDGVGTVRYEYDGLGRSVATEYDYLGQPLVRERSDLSLGGRLDGLTLEIGNTVDKVAYDYDSAARIRRVRDGFGPAVYLQATTIEPDGHYQAVTYGNGVTEQFLREPDGYRQLVQRTTATASGLFASLDEYDAAGRRKLEHQWMLSGWTDLHHTYDPLGQLRQTVQFGGANDGVEWFAHDPLGNLTMRVATTPAGSREYVSDPEDRDRLCRYAPIGTLGPCQLTYDGAGNVREDTTAGEDFANRRTFVYDAGQRITSIQRGLSAAAFRYGPLGRVTTTVTGPSPREVWSFGSLVEKRVRKDGVVQLERRIPGPLGVVATLRHDGTSQAIVYGHGDSRGNRVFTDATGHVVQDASYAPYGRVTEEHAANDPLDVTDRLWNGGDDLRELGVVLLGPRAYDPEIGRFLQRDPIVHDGTAAQANPYSFAFGDPVNLADPTGLSPIGAKEWSVFYQDLANPKWLATTTGMAVVGLMLIENPSALKPPQAVPSDPDQAAGLAIATFGAGRSSSTWSKLGSAARAVGSGISRGASEAWDFGGIVVEEGWAAATSPVRTAWGAATCVYDKGPVDCGIDTAVSIGEGALDFGGRLIDDPLGTLHEVACPGGDCRRGLARGLVNLAGGSLQSLGKLGKVRGAGKVPTRSRPGIFNRGGRFGDLDDAKLPGEVGHHMAQHAHNKRIGVSRRDGPALGMDVDDHALTRTLGGKGKRSMRVDGEGNLSTRDRMAADIRDVRRLFGSKYDNGIREMLEYARTLPEYQRQ